MAGCRETPSFSSHPASRSSAPACTSRVADMSAAMFWWMLGADFGIAQSLISAIERRLTGTRRHDPVQDCQAVWEDDRVAGDGDGRLPYADGVLDLAGRPLTISEGRYRRFSPHSGQVITIDWKGNSSTPEGTSRRQHTQVTTNCFRSCAARTDQSRTSNLRNLDLKDRRRLETGKSMAVKNDSGPKQDESVPAGTGGAIAQSNLPIIQCDLKKLGAAILFRIARL